MQHNIGTPPRTARTASQHTLHPAHQHPGRRLRGAPLHRGEHLPRHIHMGNLPAGMHPRVGPAGHRERDRYPQDRAERLRESSFHGAQARLRRPTVKFGTVVGKIKPKPKVLR